MNALIVTAIFSDLIDHRYWRAAAFCFVASVWPLWTQEPSTSRTMVDKPTACRSLFAIYSCLPVYGVRVGLVRIGATVDAPKMPTPVHAVH